jgi:hypothetical protein
MQDRLATECPVWAKELGVAITVCDRDGILLSMNDCACEVNRREGGRALLGRNLLDCHPPRARAILERLLRTGESNTYTIEKNGQRKLIHQAPWFKEGELGGLVEFSIVLPPELPHFVRS